MALVVKDRVKETSTSTGTGGFTLAGAVDGFQSFATALSNGDTTYYAITDAGTGDFEVGLGSYSAGVLTRTTILESSNAGSAVNFGAGEKEVFITYPAEKAVYLDASNNIAVPGLVDGRDLAADGSKLDGIEAGATADQTAGEIKTAYESNANTNAYTDAEKTKLAGIEAGATADQTGTEIKSLYEAQANTNAYTDAEKSKLAGIEAGADVTDATNVEAAGAVMDADIGVTVQAYDANIVSDASYVHTDNNYTTTEKNKLAGIEAGATADQTAAEIKTAYESNANTNAYTDAEKTKLAGIEAGATADQTKADIDALGINAATLGGNNAAYFTSYTDTAVANLVDSAPGTLDTLNELAAALGDDPNFATTVTNSIATKLPLSGGTMTGNVTFGDNNKAIFGAGSDLQIYHDGSHSFIDEVGTGRLYIRASDGIYMSSPSNALYLSTFDTGGLSLYHNGNAKLATTSTGIAVTGDISLSGNIIDSDQNEIINIDINDLTVFGKHIRSEFGLWTRNGRGVTGIDGSGTNLDLYANSAVKATVNSTGFNVNGNITVSGTVDGRDVAADGTKLDGIEAGATADQTITAGSGLTGGGTGNVTLSHADTSTQASVNNSGATVIQDVTLDTYGHVTSVGSTTLTAATVGAVPTGGGTFTGAINVSNAALKVGRVYSDTGTADWTNTALTVTSLGVDHEAAQTNVLRLMRDGTSGVIYAGAADFDLYRHTDSNVNPNVGLKIRLSTTETGTLYDALTLESDGTILTGSNAVWHAGNDGSGSGLDADLLDGQHGSYYYSPANAPDPTLTINGDASGSATFTNLGNATLTLTIADDSHNHVISNVDGLQTALDGKLSTSGKAADSNLLDGLDSSQFLRTDVSDTVAAGRQIRFYSYDNIESGSGGQASLVVFQDTAGADAFMQFHVSGDFGAYFGLDGSTNDFAVGGWSMGANKYKVWHAGNDGSGSGLDADLLDGQHGTYYYSPANPPPAAGAVGGGSDAIFWENDQVVTTNYTITNGKNAGSFGPITINSGVTVTVGAGEVWTVV